MTPTPNPTAEAVQKLREAVFAQSQRERDKCATGSGLYYPSIEAAETIIRAVGLLSEGAPSEEQVERAAKAYLNGGIYTLESDGEHHARMRAALTAAGVAPQEPQALDPEKVAEVIHAEDSGGVATGAWVNKPYSRVLARALCEAAKRGELT